MDKNFTKIRTKSHKSFTTFLVGCFLVIFLSGCTDEVINVDSGDIPFTDDPNTIVTIEAVIDSSLNFALDLSPASATNFIAGEFDQQTMSILMRFQNLSALSPDMEFESATLSLFPDFFYGDPVEGVQANIYEVTSKWSEGTVEGVEFNSEVKSTYTVGTSLEENDLVEIPEDLVRKWLDAINNGEDSDSTGIMIRFDAPGFAKQYLSRETFTEGTAPTLTVRFTLDGAADSVTVRPLADTYLIRGNKDFGDNFIVSNFGVHHQVFRFDVSQIPVASTINKAELILNINTERSYLKPEKEHSMIGSFVISPNWTPDSLSIVSSLERQELVDENFQVIMEIKGFVQSWVLPNNFGLLPNNGIFIRSASPTSDLSKFVFHDATTNPALQPKIIIQYTAFDTKE